jgi:hypothetical protein
MDRMGFKFLGNLHIIVVGEREPAPTDWNAYVEAIQAEERRGMPAAQMRTLVFSDGGGPNAAQRKVAREVREEGGNPLAIVTDRWLARAVITAKRVVKPHCRAFAPGDMERALEFLGVPGFKLRHILRLAREVQLGLGIAAVRSLEAAGAGRGATVSLPR